MRIPLPLVPYQAKRINESDYKLLEKQLTEKAIN